MSKLRMLLEVCSRHWRTVAVVETCCFFGCGYAWNHTWFELSSCIVNTAKCCNYL